MTETVSRAPLLVAVDMGYGHMRPAHAIAGVLDIEVHPADEPPLADEEEQRVWQRVRAGYETLTRLAQNELVGGPFRALLAGITKIPHLDTRGVLRRVHAGEVEAELGELPKDGQPPLVVFAVGGTGTQTGIARRLLPSLRLPILEGRVCLALVAGVRQEVAERFEQWVSRNRLDGHLGFGVEILFERSFAAYYRAFNTLLARADVLWTKPSELTFYGALGLPLIFAPPVGAHERCNRRWAITKGAGIRQREPKRAARWLLHAIDDGTLAPAAWAGYQSLPSQGVFRIRDAVRCARS